MTSSSSRAHSPVCAAAFLPLSKTAKHTHTPLTRLLRLLSRPPQEHILNRGTDRKGLGERVHDGRAREEALPLFPPPPSPPILPSSSSPSRLVRHSTAKQTHRLPFFFPLPSLLPPSSPPRSFLTDGQAHHSDTHTGETGCDERCAKGRTRKRISRGLNNSICTKQGIIGAPLVKPAAANSGQQHRRRAPRPCAPHRVEVGAAKMAVSIAIPRARNRWGVAAAM